MATAVIKAIVAPTMITGICSMPDEPSINTTSTTDVTGSRSTAVVADAMPIASPAVAPSPGSGATSTPSTAPRKIAGKVGPPRKLPSEIP